jgi:hypothetical protein
MPRSIQFSVSPESADLVQDRLRDQPGIMGLSRHRGASVQPPGDILLVNTSNDAARQVFTLIEELHVDPATILVSSHTALVSFNNPDPVERETNEALWEEMSSHLRQDTNIGFNYLTMMMLAGAVAAVGLWADMLHIVVGAMVIAPAFEPLVRLPFGLVIGPGKLALRGLWSTLAGYSMIAVGGAIAVLLLQWVDTQASLELSSRRWVRYWSSFSTTGVMASVFGALAGAIVISGLRSVMTTGVMIALALVPSMAIVGMGLAAGDFSVIGGGFARCAADAALVITAAALVLGGKQIVLHRRIALG